MADDVQIWQGDCLKVMADIEDGSIDLILCDLPYGVTACKWDTIIPFEPLWDHYRRLLKPRGAVVLTASQPFASMLVVSNLKWFKYSWTWDKVNRITGFLDAKKRPLRIKEDILVFCDGPSKFNPQMVKGKPYDSSSGMSTTKNYGKFTRVRTICDGSRYPQDILRIKADQRGTEGRVHPTQKPVALMEYLIRTYSSPGETVLDNCVGSGTTLVACLNTGRRGIGIELDPKYCAIARRRVSEATMTLFANADH